MDTPTARILASAAELIIAQDRSGRTLAIRRPGALDRLRMFKTLGPELAHNTAYLGMAMLAAAVQSIDDIPVPAPSNETQIEALVQRLGDDGFAAVAEALSSEMEIDSGN